MVQKKKLNNGYDIIPSRVSKRVNNQHHNMMVGEVEVGVLKSIHEVYVSDTSDLAICGSMSEIPLRCVSMGNHHDILISFGEDTQETRLSSPYGDYDVPDIMSNILSKS